jgi:DNA-binding response OmpR family regulator
VRIILNAFKYVVTAFSIQRRRLIFGGLERMKLLVAEDSRSDRVLLERILARAGHEVVSTETCEKALAAYRNGVFDAALLDWMLPSVGGLTLTKEMREVDLSTGRYCLIVMVTAKARKEDVVRALESGVDDFISKPIDEAFLLTKLKALVRFAEGVRRAKEGI